MYSIWVRLDETLPWIELKKDYQTEEEAKQAAERVPNTIAVKLVKVSRKRKPAETLITLRVES